MKKLFASILLMLCVSVYSQTVTAANNAVKMAYNFTTVSQVVVFNDSMRAGGTLSLTAQAMDGGGRAPGDPFTLKLVFYNSSNQVLATVQQANTLVLGGALAPYGVSTTNCGGSCTNVAYVSVQFYGKDGGYWAGNYGPYITTPSLTFNGGGNLLYNPEFGTYTGSGTTYAQGWSSSAGWQNCALYSGSATCVVDNGASVNASGGGYSSTGGTTSGTSGGYAAPAPAPSLCCGGSAAAFNSDASHVTKLNTFTSRTIPDAKVYVEQIGDFNIVTISQEGTTNNHAKYVGNGSSNNISIKQTAQNNTQTNYTELNVTGNYNTVDIKQRTSNETNTFTKSVFATVSGDNNILSVDQKNSGGHYASVNLSGGNKTVSITQEGSAGHMANVTLSGLPTGLTLNQIGSTQQFYSITHNCATSGGCGTISVTQGQ